MRFLVSIPLLLLWLREVAAGPLVAPTCTTNDCFSVVSATRTPTPATSPWGCASFLRTTVTPVPLTRIVTVIETTSRTTTRTVQTTEVTSTPLTRTRTNTNYETVTETTTTATRTLLVLGITTSTSLGTFTQRRPTTSYTTTSIRTSTVRLDGSGSTIRKRDPPPNTSCPAPSTTTSTLPDYASVCIDTVAYSSACSCIGFRPVSSYLPRCTTTITTTRTATNVITSTESATSTRTVVGTILSVTTSTIETRTREVTPTSTVTMTTSTLTRNATSIATTTEYSTVLTRTAATVTATVRPTQFSMLMTSDDGYYINESLASTTSGFANNVRTTAEFAIDGQDSPFTTQFGIFQNGTFYIDDGTYWFTHQYDGESGGAGGSLYSDPQYNQQGRPYNALICSIASNLLSCSCIGNTVWSYCRNGQFNEAWGLGLFLSTGVPPGCVGVTVTVAPYP